VGALNVLNLQEPMSPVGWQLHVVDVDRERGGAPTNDHIVWQMGAEEMRPWIYELEAWASEAGRAAVSMRHAAVLYWHIVRLVDTAKGETVTDVESRAASYPYMASPDGKLLAMPERRSLLPSQAAASSVAGATPDLLTHLDGALRTLDVLTGRPTVLEAFVDGDAAWPTWSPDNSLLAWVQIDQTLIPAMTAPPLPTRLAATAGATGGATPEVAAYPTFRVTPTPLPSHLFMRMMSVADKKSLMKDVVERTDERVVAFAPDSSRYAVLRPGNPLEAVLPRLQLYDRASLGTAASPTSDWTLPAGSLQFAWAPAAR
jgi:hypothetical protein